MRERCILPQHSELVDGFVPNVDYPELDAVRLGLFNRIAIVVLVVDCTERQLTFEEKVLPELEASLCRLVSHESLAIVTVAGKKFDSVSGYVEELNNIPSDERVPFVSVTFRIAGIVSRCVIARFCTRWSAAPCRIMIHTPMNCCVGILLTIRNVSPT